MATIFSNRRVLVLSLIVTDYEVLKHRIETRNQGWRDVDASWQRNQATRARKPWSNELRVDVTSDGIEAAFCLVRDSLLQSAQQEVDDSRQRINDLYADISQKHQEIARKSRQLLRKQNVGSGGR